MSRRNQDRKKKHRKTRRLLYHYTPRMHADQILRDGVIRCFEDFGYSTLFRTDEGHSLGKVVWLTYNRMVEATVAMKMHLGGIDPIGNMVRFVIEDGPDMFSIPEYARRQQLSPEWFAGKLMTAPPDSIRYWRLSVQDIPAERWNTVEIMTARPSMAINSEAELIAEARRVWQPYQHS